MEEISLKIAELLEISVESAIKMYPVLRNQFMVYKITNQILFILFVIIILAVTSSIFSTYIYKVDRNYIEDPKMYLGLVKLGYIGSVVLLFLMLVVYIYQQIYAVDLLIILEFL